MFKNLQLTHKFFLTFFLIAIIPLGIATIINYYITKAELTQKTIDNLRAVNISRASHINNMVLLRQEQARQLAGSKLLKRLRSDGNNSPKLIGEIRDYLDTIHAELNLSSSSGYTYIDQKSDIGIIAVWDVAGNTVSQTNREKLGEILGERIPMVHYESVKDKGTYFGGFHKYFETGEKFFFFNEEILNEDNGQYAGNVTFMVRANIINEITTAREGLGQTGETYIVDKRLRMITESRFLQNAVLNQSVITEATNACFNGQETSSTYVNYRGASVLGAQKYLVDQEWCLISEVDEIEAFAPIIRLRSQTMMFTELIILSILIFSIYFSRLFIKPILRLNQASRSIAGGNYKIVIPKEDNDEIGELTETFNTMTRNLADAKLQLENKNKDLKENLTKITNQKEDLEKVNKELDQFVHTVSHDIRSPLMGIWGYADLLKGKIINNINEKEKNFLDNIFMSIDRVNAMIDDLLRTTKISRVQNPYEEVNFNELINGILQRLELQIKDSDVDLHVQQNLPVVICDRIKMGEVFQNLITNAIKFSSGDKNHPKIEINYRDDDHYHEFNVKDNGIGIDSVYHAEIFKMFKCVDTSKHHDGTGVGLSIVQKVIEGQGGRVWVESKKGMGTLFFFTIPKNLKLNSS